MRKENILLWTLPIVMVFVGLFAGFYFGVYRTSLAVTACEFSKATIAPSPIITHSLYNEKTHTLKLTVANPGAMPIALLNKTLVLKPQGKQPVVVMTSIPLGITIPPYAQVDLNVELGAAGSGFNVGDVLETTLSYALPVSKDIYAVVHTFQKSNKTNKEGLIENAIPDNQVKLDAYKKNLQKK